MDSISDTSLDKIFNDSSINSQEELKATNDERYWSQKINIEIIVSDADEKYSFMHFYRLFEIVLKEYAHEFEIIYIIQQQNGLDAKWNKYNFWLNFEYRLELPPVMVIKFIRSLIQLIPCNETADMLQPIIDMFIIYSKLNTFDSSEHTYDSFMYKNVSEMNNITLSNVLNLLSNDLLVYKINTIIDLFYPEKRLSGCNYANDYMNKILIYQIYNMFDENGSTR